MNTIPLSRFLQIARNSEGRMQMVFGEHAHNHIGTAHASAQYALAEIGTGALLADLFPEYRDRTLAVLRRGEIKYRGSATSDLTAFASLDEEHVTKVGKDLAQNGRALVTVAVELKDANGAVASNGKFLWYLEIRKNLNR